MRIAVFGKSKARTQTPRSMARAFARAGHAVRVFNEAKRRQWVGRSLAMRWTLASVEHFRPDLVFVYAKDISEPVLAALSGRVPTVSYTADLWPSPVLPEHLGVCARVDLFLTCARGQVPEFERAGAKRAAYLTDAHDPELYHPAPRANPAFASEVAFIGRYHARDAALYATRAELVAAAARRFDLRIYGSGWQELGLGSAREEVFPEQYRAICAGAGIVLGCDGFAHVCEGYFSNRTWLTLGCGGFLLTNYVPGLEQFFENHGQLVWYHSVGECLELIEHYRARPVERARIAAAGHALARDHRTYDHFARDLLALVEARVPPFSPR
jgi:spore maturation protein CgeB